MITLLPTRLHWIKDNGNDDPHDLCAHSPGRLCVHGKQLVAPEDGVFTVSAAAIFLLRTLEHDHTIENPVGDQLFPCCGHAMYDVDDEDVLICGCPSGTNLIVVHGKGDRIRMTSSLGESHDVNACEWRQAVYGFVDAVREFYDLALPKEPLDDTDAAGFAKMNAEWNRRRY